MNGKSVNRREFLRLAAITGGGLVLAACAPAAAPTSAPAAQGAATAPAATAPATAAATAAEKAPAAAPASKGAVTLKFQSGWYVGAATDSLTPIINKFNEKYAPNIKTEIVNLGTTSEDLLTAIAGGSANDLYHNYNFDAQSLFAREAVLPLDDLINSHKDIFDPDMYTKEQWEGSTYNGKRLAVPGLECVASPAFSWNKTLMKDIAQPGDMVTFDQIMDWSKKSVKNDANGNLIQVGLDPLDANGAFVDMWAAVADVSYIDSEKRKFSFDNDASVKVLDTLASLYKIPGVDKMDALKQQWEYWTGGAKTGFGNGARTMILNGGWQPGELAKTQKDKSWEMGYTWMPTLAGNKKVVQFGGTHQLLIPKIAKNALEAYTLAAWIVSPDMSMLEYTIRGISCWSKPFAAKADFSKYPGLQWYMDAPSKADKVWSPGMTNTPIGGEVQKLWTRAVQETIYGQKSAKQALTDINTELQKSLDQFYAAQKK